VNGWTWQRVTRHWMALFGIVTPPLDAVLNTIVAAQQPSYNFLHNWVSDLTATGRPLSGILRAWWATIPLQLGPFAFALALGLRGKQFGKLVPVLLALFAVCVGLCGIFPFDPYNPAATAASRIHIIVSSLSTVLLFPCPFLLWLVTRHDDNWRVVARFGLVMQVPGIAAGIMLGLTLLHITDWRGLIERSFWAVYYIWIVGVALKLREMDSP
jgi:hypothetical membrane protein